ncbi:ATP binding protein [Aureococcus anophagefferens]|nr:ATP binding protein [Aureococcus anophagefferens]
MADFQSSSNVTYGARCTVHASAQIDATKGPIAIGDDVAIDELVTIRNDSGAPMRIGDGNWFQVGSACFASRVGDYNVFKPRSVVAPASSSATAVRRGLRRARARSPTAPPSSAAATPRTRAPATTFWSSTRSILGAARNDKRAEVLYTVIEALTPDARDHSLDYKISGLSVGKGSWEAQVVAGLAPGADDIVLPKGSSSVFCSTNVAYVLRNLGVDQVVLVGGLTDQCVESAVVDLNGKALSKTVPREHAGEGVFMYSGALAMGADARVLTFPKCVGDAGCPNWRLEPQWDTLQRLPWASSADRDVFRVYCETLRGSKADAPKLGACPRAACARRLAALKEAHGVDVYAASELEFVLTDDEQRPRDVFEAGQTDDDATQSAWNDLYFAFL